MSEHVAIHGITGNFYRLLMIAGAARVHQLAALSGATLRGVLLRVKHVDALPAEADWHFVIPRVDGSSDRRRTICKVATCKSTGSLVQ